VTLGEPAPYSAAQLMKLGEPQPFRIFNNHQRRIGYIYPDLNDGGGDQEVDSTLLELVHNAGFFGIVHAAVNEANREFR
jgi:hypothetical protein